jgi:hypothetical protein
MGNSTTTYGYLPRMPSNPPAPSVAASLQQRLSGKSVPSKPRDWGRRGSEQYRKTNRQYMHDYREHPMRRQRENAFKKLWRRKRRRRARTGRPAAELTPRGRFLKPFRQRRYYDRCKEKGWHRVRVLEPCITCSTPTRWRKRAFAAELGVDLTTMMEKAVNWKWRWRAQCRQCENRRSEEFIPDKAKLGVLYASSGTQNALCINGGRASGSILSSANTPPMPLEKGPRPRVLS